MKKIIFFGALAVVPLFFVNAQTGMMAPENLTATVSSPANDTNLTWVDNSELETEFQIYRRVSYGTWIKIGVSTKNTTTYKDLSPAPGSYEYKVQACNTTECSSDSNIITVNIYPDTESPTAPTMFNISEITNTSAYLTWAAATDNIGIKSYNIYRSNSGSGNFAFVASVSGDQLSHRDTTLSAASSYAYFLKASDYSNHESYSTNIISIVTKGTDSASMFIRLVQPNGGECYDIGTNLPIRWTGVGIQKTAVYFSGKMIFLENATAFDYFLNASTSLGSPSIKVVSIDVEGKEGIYDENDAPFTLSYNCSKEVNIAVPTKPQTPSVFKAFAMAEKTGVRLMWQDNSSNETGFKLYRKLLPAGTWKMIAEIGANITEYIDNNVAPGTYEYDVSACNTAGCSAYSNVFQFTVYPTIATQNTLKEHTILELKAGDLISVGTDDPDIYIINQNGFKRLFLNPVIFNFYGHLGGFQNVKLVSAVTRDHYKTSGLFRNCESDSPEVYGVTVSGEDTGILHWINTTGEKAVTDDPDFFKKVFCINNNEFGWYQKGNPFMSVSEIPIYSR
jgi:fibronectin type 3 domain-containing protein